jgi:DNA-binding beta-propeller fold protein YncE
MALACLLLLAAMALPTGAAAFRQSLNQKTAEGREEWITDEELQQLPFETEKQIEGACGLAVSPALNAFFVADYYHRAVHEFRRAGFYMGSQLLAGGEGLPTIDKSDAVCGLAIDAAGHLYANEFQQRVIRLPGEEVIDPGQATGIAVDSAGDLYVDDRTYVAVYDAPVSPGDQPAEKIGLGSLNEGFGVAVDSKRGLVYVAEAAEEAVDVFEPGTSPTSLTTPVRSIAGPAGKASFNSLVNASLAVDESGTEGDGHLLVVDDLGPSTAVPRAAVYEFGPAGEFLDRLATRKVGRPGEVEEIGPVFGEPSGIAIDQENGKLFVTTGNSEGSNVLVYGPYEATAPPQLQGGGGSGESAAARSAAPAGAAAPAPSASGTAAASVVTQRQGVRVNFNGKLTPQALPRHGVAPVGIAIDAQVGSSSGEDPPQLRRISIAINRNGHFNPQGLPLCRLDRIQPSTTEGARAACGSSLVGEGSFSANVKLPQQSPFPSAGKVLAFNGRLHGKPAILAHIYGTVPVPTSVVLPFVIGGGRGTYGTTLEASLPQATGNWGYVTGLRMNLHRSFRYRGKSRSYLSAGCPAPPGFPSASFPLARTRFAFAGGPTLVSVLSRTCRARS